MAKIFENDGKDAWAALHKGILAGLAETEPKGVIVQPLQVAERADWDTSNTFLNLYREQRIANQVPTWNATYIPCAGMNVPDEYQAFLDTLNSKIITESGALDKAKLDKINRERMSSQDRLQKNEYFINKQWDRYVANNRGKPPLSRPQWETDFGYATTRLAYQREVELANASYIREINNGGGELLEVGRAISALADPRQKIPLPQDEIEADLSSENWQYWYRASLTDGLQSFLSDEFNWSIDLTEASEKTSRFEDRWSAGAGFSYFAVFGANGGADNETIRKHAELDTSAIKIHFSNIQSFTVDRGNWFKPGVISQFRDRMPPGFWGEAGRLNLIPTQVILVRGLRIEVLTSAQVTDYFFNKKSAGGGAGFRIGPWRIGGSGHRTTIEESYEMHRSSTGFLLEDVSQRAQILAVTSIRNIDLLKQTEDPAPTYRMLAEPEIREARALLDRARRAAPSALESLGVS